MPGKDVIDETRLGIVENLVVDRPRLHRGDELLAHLHGQFFCHLEDIFRQRVDHHLTLGQLKISQRFLHAPFEHIGGVGVGSVEVETKWNRRTIR